MSIFLRLYDYFTQPIQVFYLISDHITILRSIYHFKVHLHLRFHHHRSPLTSKYSTIIFPEWASCSFISVLHHIHLLSSNRHSLPLPFHPLPISPPNHTHTHIPKYSPSPSPTRSNPQRPNPPPPYNISPRHNRLHRPCTLSPRPLGIPLGRRHPRRTTRQERRLCTGRDEVFQL